MSIHITKLTIYNLCEVLVPDPDSEILELCEKIWTTCTLEQIAETEKLLTEEYQSLLWVCKENPFSLKIRLELFRNTYCTIVLTHCYHHGINIDADIDRAIKLALMAT